MSSRTECIFLSAVLMASFAINSINLGFPVHYHADEPKKARFVRTFDQDFAHPILMLQFGRILNLPFQYSDDNQLIVLCRMVSVVAGVVVVYFTYRFAKLLMPSAWSLATALALALTPIMVVHAHYYKEDMLLTACLLGALFTYHRFLEVPTWWRLGLWSVATGLAFSTHYKSILLVPIYLIYPFMRSTGKKTAYVGNLVLCLAIASVVFFDVNYPIFDDLNQFKWGVNHEFRHALEGHTLKINPTDFYFCFHLIYSILPGILWPLMVLGVARVGCLLVCWNKASSVRRLLLFTCLLFYFIVEASPTKPAIGFPRYILPVVPFLVIFAFEVIHCGVRRFPATTVVATAQIVFSSLYITSRLLYYLDRDTRAVAHAIVRDSGHSALFEQYSGLDRNVRRITKVNVKDAMSRGVDCLVTSNFNYERFFLGSRMQGQSHDVYETAASYDEMFKTYHYTEIRPAYKSYLYSNPTIRILHLDKPRRKQRGVRD